MGEGLDQQLVEQPPEAQAPPAPPVEVVEHEAASEPVPAAEPETHPDLVEAPAAEAESGDEPTHIADIEHEDDDKGGDDDRMAGLVDNSKAWDMAHAAKPERDHAAKLRALNKIDTELLPEVEDFFENYDTIPADQRPRIQEELLERIRPVVAANRSGNMHLMDADLE